MSFFVSVSKDTILEIITIESILFEDDVTLLILKEFINIAIKDISLWPKSYGY